MYFTAWSINWLPVYARCIMSNDAFSLQGRVNLYFMVCRALEASTVFRALVLSSIWQFLVVGPVQAVRALTAVYRIILPVYAGTPANRENQWHNKSKRERDPEIVRGWVRYSSWLVYKRKCRVRLLPTNFLVARKYASIFQ